MTMIMSLTHSRQLPRAFWCSLTTYTLCKTINGTIYLLCKFYTRIHKKRNRNIASSNTLSNRATEHYQYMTSKLFYFIQSEQLSVTYFCFQCTQLSELAFMFNPAKLATRDGLNVRLWHSVEGLGTLNEWVANVRPNFGGMLYARMITPGMTNTRPLSTSYHTVPYNTMLTTEKLTYSWQYIWFCLWLPRRRNNG